MLFWILAFFLLAAGVLLGWRIGAICASFSFVGLVFATMLAGLVGKLFAPILPHVGVENPVLKWAIAPVAGFIPVWILFMAAGFEAQRRALVHYKYHAGDLRLALWERLNSRLGICVGVLIGTAWMVLVSFFIFNLSYWTAQIAPGEDEAKMTRIVNSLGEGMQSSGLDKAARSVGSMPDLFYKTANFAGLLAQNPTLSSRLGTYPAFLSLQERNDIKSLAQDSTLMDAWQSGAPMGAILNDSQVKNILQNTDLVATVWGIVVTNMDDLTNYLITGQSPKYDPEKIVGRWNFDVIPSLAALRQAQPKMSLSSKDMRELREMWTQAFANTTVVAGTDNQIFLENIPDFKTKPPQTQTWTGQWSEDGADYDLSISANNQTETATAQTDGLRLTIKMSDGTTYVFQRTY